MKKKILKNSEGFLTADYLFALVLAMGFMIILFALSMTLTVVDVVQYMTYSAARVYSVSHLDESVAKQNSFNKFRQLFLDSRVNPLFGEDKWFIVGEPEIGDLSNIYEVSEDKYGQFYGVSVGFNAKMLDIKIPFYGSTNTRDSEDGFVTAIHSVLGRESSVNECININRQRLEWLYRSYTKSPRLRNSLNNYKVMSDNGC